MKQPSRGLADPLQSAYLKVQVEEIQQRMGTDEHCEGTQPLTLREIICCSNAVFSHRG